MNRNEADIINLGYGVRRILKLDYENYTDLQIGYSFVDYLNKIGITENLRTVAKKLMSPLGINEVLLTFSWAVEEKINNIITDPIPVVFSEASCTIRLFSNVDKTNEFLINHQPFYIGDAIWKFENFIVIDRVVSFKTLAGKEMLNVLKSVDIPCIAQVGYLFCGDYDYANENNDWSYLDNLVKKYKQYGFVDINNIIGYYEDSIIMSSKGLKEIYKT